MNIEQYIETGIIEAYVLGVADPAERAKFEEILPSSPALQKALLNFELKLEEFALLHSSPPPPGTWERIEDRMRELPVVKTPFKSGRSSSQNGNGRWAHDEFLSIGETSSTHLRLHKNWRTAFILIFILSKIFLALAIYYFVEYRHAEKDIRLLEQQANQRTK